MAVDSIPSFEDKCPMADPRVFIPSARCDGEAFANAMPKWMSSAHFFDLTTEWTTFVSNHQRKARPTCPS